MLVTLTPSLSSSSAGVAGAARLLKDTFLMGANQHGGRTLLMHCFMKPACAVCPTGGANKRKRSGVVSV